MRVLQLKKWLCGMVVMFAMVFIIRQISFAAVDVTFSYTGSDQTFTVPSGVTQIFIKAWGAGGGGGAYPNGWDGAPATEGGAGGYASGYLSVVSGQQLTVIVGEGGTSPTSASSASTYGGGGGVNGTLGGGKGGGRSAVRNASNTEFITAGGGGGGSNSTNYDTSTGGAGGGANGVSPSSACSQSGGGASQSAGGCAAVYNGATAGSAFQGGMGSYPSHATSGGGGGYYGGGGANIGAGGGGSGYSGGVTGGILIAGSGTTPPNIDGANYISGIGVGGFADGGMGGNGLIVISYEQSTAVTLSSFTAGETDDGGVILRWETAAEIDNAGFNIYRSKHKNGAYTKINEELIAANGSETEGASYSYEDTPPKRGTYYYKLEDVDSNGVSTMHGPVKGRIRNGASEAKRR